MKINREPVQITEGIIWKQLLLFFFPIMLGMLFQQMYNIVDTVVVGQFVGTQALAAVGASAPLTRLLIGFFMGISSGATVVLSLHYGAKNGQGVHDAIHTGMAVAVAGGLLATVSLVVSRILNYRFLVLLAPFIGYMFLASVFPMIGLPYWNPRSILQGTCSGDALPALIVENLVLLVISLAGFVWKGAREDVF